VTHGINGGKTPTPTESSPSAESRKDVVQRGQPFSLRRGREVRTADIVGPPACAAKHLGGEAPRKIERAKVSEGDQKTSQEIVSGRR